MAALSVIPRNAQHQGRREEQQDAFAFSDPAGVENVHAGFLALVADGMGGMSFGKEAAQTAIRAFLDAYAAKARDESIPAALKRAARQANGAVRNFAEEHAEVGETGTTLAAAVIHDDLLYWLSVGDSRIYRLNDNSITKLNEEHNLNNKLRRLADQGLIDEEEALDHPQKEALTSYIGIEDLWEIDMPDRPLRLHAGDQIILCSDGLYKALSDAEIFVAARGAVVDRTVVDRTVVDGAVVDRAVAKGVVMDGTVTEDTASRLVENVIRKEFPHQDNVTVVTLSLEKGGEEARKRERPAAYGPDCRDIIVRIEALKKKKRRARALLIAFAVAVLVVAAAAAFPEALVECRRFFRDMAGYFQHP
ncbi:MAG: protein phosphatase 2C domain-containing protein [Synergistaceae bacterium]|jgi:protein phosphatase|nr:protein phosphatase 2C domain-containing protein [Synergistaceae bacterium]